MAKFQIVSNLLLSLVVSLVLATDSHQQIQESEEEESIKKNDLKQKQKPNDNLSRELNLVRNQINIPIPVVDGGSTHISFEISYTVQMSIEAFYPRTGSVKQSSQ